LIEYSAITYIPSGFSANLAPERKIWKHFFIHLNAHRAISVVEKERPGRL
jgi:hypothetical protein